MSAKFPQLIVLNEKHCTHYVFVKDEAEQQLAFVKIVESRKRDGWYSDLEQTGLNAPLDYGEKDIQAMSKSMQAAAAKRFYEHGYARNESMKLKALLDRIPTEPAVAWPFLRQRSGYEYEALKRTAQRLTGKSVVDHVRSEQTLTEIRANSFQDLLHELSHWLIATPIERLEPNLGLPDFMQDGVHPLEAIRESQAIFMHSAIAREIGMDDEEIEYVSYLEEAIGICCDSAGVSLSSRLQRDLLGLTPSLVGQVYAQELQALEEA